MPSLPTYNSSGNIEVRPSAPQQTGAEQPYKDLEGVTKTLQDVTQKWSDVNDVIQYTNAKASYDLTAAKIQATASADTGIQTDANGNPVFVDNTKKYQEQLTEAHKNVMSGISNQQVAGKANMDFSLNNELATIKIGSEFKKKSLEFNKGQVGIAIDAEQNKIINGSPAVAEQARQNIEKLLQAQVKTGAMTFEEANKILKNSQKTSVQYQIYNDSATSEKDSTVLKQLRDQDDPKYSYLDPKTRLDLIEESQRRIFQNNQTFKREVDTSQTQRNNDFIDKLATQTATFRDIDNELKIPEEQGGMKRSVLLQYRKYLEGNVDKTLNEYMKEKNTGTKESTKRAKMATDYNDLIETYLSDKTDQWKAKELVAKGLADGLLDAEELKILNPLKDNLKDIKFNKDTSPLAWSIKKVKEFMGSSNASSEDIALRVKQMLSSIGAGDTPQGAMTKAMDSEMLKHFPDYSTYPKEGKKYLDKKSGRAYVVYSDGKWAWVEK